MSCGCGLTFPWWREDWGRSASSPRFINQRLQSLTRKASLQNTAARCFQLDVFLKKPGVMSCAWSSSYLGEGGRRIAWVQVFRASLSQHSKTISEINKNERVPKIKASFYNLFSKASPYYFCHLLSRSKSFSPIHAQGEGIKQGYPHPEMRIIVGCLPLVPNPQSLLSQTKVRWLLCDDEFLD